MTALPRLRIARALLPLLLVAALCATGARPQDPAARIAVISDQSHCAKALKAPANYVRGMAFVYARAICEPHRPDVTILTQLPGPRSLKSDGLKVYQQRLESAGAKLSPPGPDLLKSTYALLTGLGVRESSGRYCAGRYLHQGFDNENNAEAGLFQTSWGAHRVSPVLSQMFMKYKNDESACLLSRFSPANCGSADQKNWGKAGTDGVAWQELTKRCPAFAAEYGAVVLRRNGGSAGEFGPIRCAAGTQKRPCNVAEVSPMCVGMYNQVEQYLNSNPQLCSAVLAQLRSAAEGC